MDKKVIRQEYRIESSVYHKFDHNVPGEKTSLGETRIGLIRISMIESEEFDFSILFPKIIAREMSNIEVNKINSFIECIAACKEVPYYYRDIYKIMIYSVDYAMHIFSKHTNCNFKQKLIIEPVFESMGIVGCGMAIATISGIWKLLNFNPNKEFLPEIIDYEITVHNSFIPRWVERDLKQDPNEAFQWAGIDEDFYESNCRYKWVV